MDTQLEEGLNHSKTATDEPTLANEMLNVGTIIEISTTNPQPLYNYQQPTTTNHNKLFNFPYYIPPLVLHDVIVPVVSAQPGCIIGKVLCGVAPIRALLMWA